MDKSNIVLIKGEANVSCGSAFGHPHSAGKFTYKVVGETTDKVFRIYILQE